MKMNTKKLLRLTVVKLRSICFDGTALPIIMKRGMKRTRRVELAIIFYVLSIGSAFLLFDNYALLFTSQKLFNTNTSILVTVLLEPVVYLSACIYFLTLGMAFMRTIVPVFLIGLIFMLDNKFNLNSFLSLLLILSAFIIYYFQFYKNYDDLKQPILSKTLNASLALFIIFISLAISLNFYSGFSNRIGQLSNSLGTSISKRFGFIENNYASSTSKGVAQETLRQHVIRNLTASKLSVTEDTITASEKELIKGLGLPSARPNDNYVALLDKATKRQIDLTINNYRKIFAIVVPFAFFFVTDVLANVSSNVAWLALFITERVFRKRLLPE
jgi:hypothetical protein